MRGRAFPPGCLGPAPALQTLKPQAAQSESVPWAEWPLSAQMIVSHCTGSAGRESNDVMQQRDLHCERYKAAAGTAARAHPNCWTLSGLIQSVATRRLAF